MNSQEKTVGETLREALDRPVVSGALRHRDPARRW
jgi:hypothetical protein